MNFIDKLLLKTGKGIYYGAIKISKDICYGAITTLLLSTSLIPNLWTLNSYLWWCVCHSNNGISFSKISVPSFNAYIM